MSSEIPAVTRSDLILKVFILETDIDPSYRTPIGIVLRLVAILNPALAAIGEYDLSRDMYPANDLFEDL
ncbi:hypothetical protein IIA15_10820 [candidate division TA06 bacterium]|nr:hypothetical protein [candidate division TA06 bacterium]